MDASSPSLLIYIYCAISYILYIQNFGQPSTSSYPNSYSSHEKKKANMTPQIDFSTALSALTNILTAELNALNDEAPTDPPPPILSLIGTTIFGFQRKYRTQLRILITVPSSSSAPDSNPEPLVWEWSPLASNSTFSTAAEVDEFIKTLEKVNVTSLMPDARECDICKTDFSHSPGPTPARQAAQRPAKQSVHDEEQPESPVRLACGHVYGERCLKTWIGGKGIGNLPTCPMCRAVLDSGNIAVSEVTITLDRPGALSSMR